MDNKMDMLTLSDVTDFTKSGQSPSLLGNSAITSHLEQCLRNLGHNEKSISSLKRCQENTGGYYLKWCDCGFSNAIHPLKHYCNNRTCSVCAKKRKKKLQNKYLISLQNLPQTKTLNLKFLTISPENYIDLEFGLKDIRKNFRKFIRRKYIKERIFGSLYILECKQQKKGDSVFSKKTGRYLYTVKETSWNIHIHAIIYGKYLQNKIKGVCHNCGSREIKYDYETKKFSCSLCESKNVIAEKDSELVREWKASSNNQNVNMHITNQVSKHTGRNNPEWSLNYMLKYITANKDDFIDEESEALYIHTTYKTRLIETTGIFKGHWEKGKFIKFEWIKKKNRCRQCGSIIYYMTCFEIDEAISYTLKIKKAQELQKWLEEEKIKETLQQKAKIKEEKEKLIYYIIQ